MEAQMNSWDFNYWGFFDMVAILLLALIAANVLKKYIKFLRESLIPTSVLGGLFLLIISTIYKAITKQNIFETSFFGNRGTEALELITYHSLAFGFIATTFASKKEKLNKKRTGEIFDTGVTTVSTYLIQAIVGLGTTIIAVKFVKGLIECSGILLPFGYGQGTGQALNWGNIYETDYGFTGGKNFGLSIAALGFLCASIGGVIHLNILKRKGKIKAPTNPEKVYEQPFPKKEEPFMNGGLDSFTIQIAAIFITYLISYGIIFGLGKLIPGFKSVLYGFNFLIGVLMAVTVKGFLKLGRKINFLKNDYIDKDEMNKISSFCFDLMIVAGIAAIQIDLLLQYYHILLILGLLGFLVTYFYNRFVAKILFPNYEQEQFMVMYGMLTGTASTGIILLREIDKNFDTPAADNLVYQNFPAIVFGFPMMLLAALAPKDPVKTLIILAVFFIVMNIILFRRQIFCRKKKV